jgi:hypothetical protein
MKIQEFLEINSYCVASNDSQQQEIDLLLKNGVIKPMSLVDLPSNLTSEQLGIIKSIYVLGHVKHVWQLPICLNKLIKTKDNPRVGDFGHIHIQHNGYFFDLLVQISSMSSDLKRSEVVIIPTFSSIWIDTSEFTPTNERSDF